MARGKRKKKENVGSLAISSVLCSADYLISNHDGDILVGRVTPWKTFVSITQRIERQLQR